MKRLTIPLAVLAICGAAVAQQGFQWKNEDATSGYGDNYIPTKSSGYTLVKKVALDGEYDLQAVSVVGFDRGVHGDELYVKVMADNNGLPDPSRLLVDTHKTMTVNGRLHEEVVQLREVPHVRGNLWVSLQTLKGTGYIAFDPWRSDTDFLFDGSMIGKSVMQQGGRWVITRGGSLGRTYSIRLLLGRPGGPPPDEDDDHDHHHGQPPRVQPPDPLTELLGALDVVFRARCKTFRVRPSRSFYYWADDQASSLAAIYVPFWLEGVDGGDQVTVRVEGIPEEWGIDAGGELQGLIVGAQNGYGMRNLYWRLYDGRRYYPMRRYSGWSDRSASIECHGCCPFEGTCYTGGGAIEVSFRATRCCDPTFRGYVILGIDEDWTRSIQRLMTRQR